MILICLTCVFFFLYSVPPVDCDPNLKPSTSVELEGLIVRLEHIVDRLERAVSAHELEVATKVLDTAKSLRELTGTPSSTKTTDSELNQQLPAVLDDQLPTTLDTVVVAAVAPAKPHKKQHNLKLKIDSTANSINLSHNSFEEDIDHLPTVISQILPQSPPPPDQKTTDICRTMSVNAYQDIMYGPLAKFLELSSKIGGDVATQANFVKLAFE
jgi:adenylyl cyclase-associated protein